jgi:mannose-6-phosphate isomerase-like protein (cupin superfamily)
VGRIPPRWDRKVPAYKEHSVTNTGGEGLIFLVIYDPPNIDGTP